MPGPLGTSRIERSSYDEDARRYVQQVINARISSMLETLKREGVDATVENARDIDPDHLSYYARNSPNSICYYAGSDDGPVAHLADCVLICRPEISGLPESVVCIKTSDPKLAFYILSGEFAPPKPPPGIHPTAIVSPHADIAPTVSVGPYCVLDDCVLYDEVVLHHHVTVYGKTTIGRGTVIESNTVIGASGKTWAWGPDGRQWEMPQLGGTRIGDDCFLGSNITVVRGSLEDTVIEENVKIAHGTMIGHDSRIGAQTQLSNAIALGGTTVIGKRCFIGSGVCCRAKVRLGNDVVVGVGAVVVHDCMEEGTVLAGVPARKLEGVGESRDPTGMPKLRRQVVK